MTPQVTVLATDTGGINGVALSVLIALFLLVSVAGFMASRFKRGESLESLDEWGLGGRKFGTWITWFLLGGEHALGGEGFCTHGVGVLRLNGAHDAQLPRPRLYRIATPVPIWGKALARTSRRVDDGA